MEDTLHSDLSFLGRPVAVFDFDGTLCNTAPVILHTAETVLGELGFSRERMGDLTRLIGPPLVDGFRDCFGLSQDEAEKATARYRYLFDFAAPDDYPPIPGALELLDALRGQGRRIAVATSRREESAVKLSRETGILERVDALAGLKEPERHTKAESIAAVLDMLGASADEAFMVGDRHHDVEGAAELGMPCVGVYTGAAKPGELEGAGASLVCAGLDELLERIRRVGPSPCSSAMG